MSETFSKVEVITGVARRRRFPMDQKLAVVAETMQPGMSISYVARRHGLSPSTTAKRFRIDQSTASWPIANMLQKGVKISAATFVVTRKVASAVDNLPANDGQVGRRVG